MTQTTKKTQDRMFIIREPFNNADHDFQVRRPLGKQTGSARDGRGDVGRERESELAGRSSTASRAVQAVRRRNKE